MPRIEEIDDDELELESNPGEGANFHLTFPVNDAAMASDSNKPA